MVGPEGEGAGAGGFAVVAGGGGCVSWGEIGLLETCFGVWTRMEMRGF